MTRVSMCMNICHWDSLFCLVRLTHDRPPYSGHVKFTLQLPPILMLREAFYYFKIWQFYECDLNIYNSHSLIHTLNRIKILHLSYVTTIR